MSAGGAVMMRGMYELAQYRRRVSWISRQRCPARAAFSCDTGKGNEIEYPGLPIVVKFCAV